MNILFTTIALPDMSTNAGGLYADMIRQLTMKGHNITVVTSTSQPNTSCKVEGVVKVIRTHIPYFSANTSLIRKGIASILMVPLFKKALNKYVENWNFDVVFIPTPPATLIDVAAYAKKKCGCKIYSILRDIQPECANRPYRKTNIDDAMVMDEAKVPYGINPLARRLLYKESQKLYRLSDYIGCMSPGNIDFVKKIAPDVKDENLYLLPNWYTESASQPVDNLQVREKYKLQNKVVAIFGGNIGPQQAIWNIVTLAEHYRDNDNVRFLVVGRGTKKKRLQELISEKSLNNVLCLEYMPRNDYEAILQIADVGIISLDEKYEVPTCPSKAIGYMVMKKPVIAMINENSDYGQFYLTESGCGLWSAGLDNQKMFDNFDWLISHPVERKQMGEKGYQYYKTHFSTEIVCDILCKQLNNE